MAVIQVQLATMVERVAGAGAEEKKALRPRTSTI